MGLFKKIITMGRSTDSDNDGQPDYQELEHNDRNNNRLLDHLEANGVDTNQDGMNDTEVELSSDMFSRKTHIQKSRSSYTDDNDNGMNDIYESDMNDVNDNSIPDYDEGPMDTDGDGFDDLDIDLT